MYPWRRFTIAEAILGEQADEATTEGQTGRSSVYENGSFTVPEGGHPLPAHSEPSAFAARTFMNTDEGYAAVRRGMLAPTRSSATPHRFGRRSITLASKLDFRPALAYTYGAMNVVYILRCDDGSLYTGAAKDLARRLAQHAAGRASRYTRARLPVTLLWSRRERSWSSALQTEHWIKQLPRSAKNAIIEGARLRVRRR